MANDQQRQIGKSTRVSLSNPCRLIPFVFIKENTQYAMLYLRNFQELDNDTFEIGEAHPQGVSPYLAPTLPHPPRSGREIAHEDHYNLHADSV